MVAETALTATLSCPDSELTVMATISSQEAPELSLTLEETSEEVQEQCMAFDKCERCSGHINEKKNLKRKLNRLVVKVKSLKMKLREQEVSKLRY